MKAARWRGVSPTLFTTLTIAPFCNDKRNTNLHVCHISDFMHKILSHYSIVTLLNFANTGVDCSCVPSLKGWSNTVGKYQMFNWEVGFSCSGIWSILCSPYCLSAFSYINRSWNYVVHDDDALQIHDYMLPRKVDTISEWPHICLKYSWSVQGNLDTGLCHYAVVWETTVNTFIITLIMVLIVEIIVTDNMCIHRTGLM